MSMERPTNGESGEQGRRPQERQHVSEGISPSLEIYGKEVAPEESQKPLPREYRKKVYFFKRLVEKGSYPATDEGRELFENPVKIGKNREALDQGTVPETQQIKDHLRSRNLDVFDVQKASGAFASALLRDTQPLDMIDLLMAVRMSQFVSASLTEGANDTSVDRLKEVKEGCIRELVSNVSYLELRDASELNLEDTWQRLYGIEELSVVEQQDLNLVASAINGRVAIAQLVIDGSLQDADRPRGKSSYSKESSPEELARLNRTAADTLERLHLLKAYGVTPFEVSGERVRLPWDIAVEPPLDFDRNGNISGGYAPGAIADFLFLAPSDNRESLQLEIKEGSEDRTQLAVGDAETLLRLRLHDNGQLSDGHRFHNIPSDLTEQAFAEFNAGDAFQKIRGLLIALAFDALVPDDVTSGEKVRGSVASSFQKEPHETAGKRVTELLLRRREALRSARVNEGQRRPEGWTLPQHSVRGYFRKVPEGAAIRPTAEAEARAYYQDINIPFPGMPEGKTFVNPFERGGEDSSVVYRQARFRTSSATSKFTKGL